MRASIDLSIYCFKIQTMSSANRSKNIIRVMKSVEKCKKEEEDLTQSYKRSIAHLKVVCWKILVMNLSLKISFQETRKDVIQVKIMQPRLNRYDS